MSLRPSLRRVCWFLGLAAGSAACFVAAAFVIDMASEGSSMAAENAVRALASRLTDGRLSTFDERRHLLPGDVDQVSLDVDRSDVRVRYDDGADLRVRAAGDLVLASDGPLFKFEVTGREAHVALSRSGNLSCDNGECLASLIEAATSPNVELSVPRTWAGGLTLKTRDGDVKIDASKPGAVTGALKVDIVDGNFKMKLGPHTGAVTIDAVNGNVRLRLAENAGSNVTVRTKEGGRVKVATPWKGTLDESVDGDYDVLSGAIGGGGTPVMVTAEAGNVELREL